jgi:hypothetical protein
MRPIPNTTNTYKPISNAAWLIRYHDPIQHFKIIQKFGFPPGVKCWCGASLEFAVKEDWASRDKKRKVFFDEHEECEAQQQ